MTITVGAGITLEKLRQILAAESQELPLDIPQADQATIGGCIAANISGFRRLGSGTLRDYVIGIEAVDGRGAIYHGGGRVVKNVAGYDFCRLLIGRKEPSASSRKSRSKSNRSRRAVPYCCCPLPI